MPKLDNLEEAVEAEIGERIRNRRAVLGMSQAELADRIGMSFQQVQKYERGANRIASSILVRVADALDCAPGDLLSSHKGKARVSASDREIDGIASRLKMLKSTPARKKILAAMATMLADAETAMKGAKTAAPRITPAAKSKSQSKTAAKKRKQAR